LKELRKAKHIEGATMPDGQVLNGDSNPNGPTFEQWLEEWRKKEEQRQRAG
jgi:hypothetical protein